MITILLNLMGKIILMVALGYFLRRRGIITEQFQADITNFMMKVALPASVLTTADNPFTRELSRNLLITVLIALGYYGFSFLAARAISLALPLEERSKRMFMILAIFANTSFLGFPLAEELLGAEGLLYAVVFNMVWILVFFTAGVGLITGQKKPQLRSILTVPVSVASIAAVLIYVSPFRFPAFIQGTLSSLGGMVVPLSMIVIGCSLVPVKLTEILKDRYAYLTSALRLLVFPFAVLAVLWAIPGVPHMVAVACALECCLPSASLCAVFAQQYRCDPAYASRAVIQGMLLMLATVPLFITCAFALLPL